MSEHRPQALNAPFFSTGTYVGLAVVAIGVAFGAVRMLFGIGTVTNLDDAYPWGLWVGVDVACGVALAAGGFTTAALVDIFGRHKFHALLRPAILTAWLGYAFVAFAVFFDIGRYWNIWRPMFHWQGNSALFEVGMCVMAYLTVLTFEMSPAVLEGLQQRVGETGVVGSTLAALRGPLDFVSRVVRAVLPIFIITGVVLSCMHQSSLGTMLAIAPTKVSPYWFSPLLPLLFLLSAFMVGPAMVILESLLASRAFRREPEMDLLGPLSAYIPWLIGVYGAFRVGDLLVRWRQLEAEPSLIMALSVELLVGLVLPFLLLVQPRVRRSPVWLLIAASLVIAGVVLNRVNTYIVGFEPPFASTRYVPAVGELAVTAGIIATIVLLYRFFVIFFPVLPAAEHAPYPEAHPRRIRWRTLGPISDRWATAYRAVGLVAIMSFVALYAIVHEEATGGEIRSMRWSSLVRPIADTASTGQLPEHPFRPQGYQRVYTLDSEILNARDDFFEPVRFSHTAHDNATGGDCSPCHHRFSYSSDDRVGDDLGAFHLDMMGVRIAGPCATCHDMAEVTTQRCDSCHARTGEGVEGNPIGLKGAYHRQCIGCHEDQPPGVRAPVDCVSCHHPHTPDHAELVELPSDPTMREITRECLRCHEEVGADMMSTAHWLWRGHSSFVVGHEDDVLLGLNTVMNNHCFTVGQGSTYCATCHIGTGWDEEGFDFTDRTRIDCLICHDTTGLYHRGPGGGRPEIDADLAQIAGAVGRPAPRNCGACHYRSGGALNSKHGDLEPVAEPEGRFPDVHVGRLDMRCQDCHTTTRHKIAGVSVSAPASEGRVRCESCHGSRPHGISGVLGTHLDEHVRAVSCESCHIPFIARENATRTYIDFSRVGQDEVSGDHQGAAGSRGLPGGDQEWEKNLVPTYRWWDGTRQAYVLGDRIDPRDTVELNRPLGESYDPDARIFPFKVHEAVQPYDKNNKVLLVPPFEDLLTGPVDWNRLLADGAEAVGLEYSGEHGWVRTRMYTGVHHGVVPAGQALGCADCHETRAVGCQRCHSAASGIDLPDHRNRLYPEATSRIDFEALGYDDDPALVGGRFYTTLGRGTPVR